MTTTDFDATCPHCGKLQEAHTSIDGDAVPKPGDLSFCITCGGISTYNEDMQLAHLTEKQMKAVDTYVPIQKMTKAWLRVRDRRGK